MCKFSMNQSELLQCSLGQSRLDIKSVTEVNTLYNIFSHSTAGTLLRDQPRLTKFDFSGNNAGCQHDIGYFILHVPLCQTIPMSNVSYASLVSYCSCY